MALHYQGRLFKEKRSCMTAQITSYSKVKMCEEEEYERV